jgi:serine/threonine-protein kinase
LRQALQQAQAQRAATFGFRSQCIFSSHLSWPEDLVMQALRESFAIVALILVLGHVTEVMAQPTSAPELSSRVQDILKKNCFECHGGKKTSAGVKILDRELLVSKQKITPGKPDESLLLQMVQATDESRMPPEGRPALTVAEIAVLRQWIAAGAPAFAADRPSNADPATRRAALDEEYVLRSILSDIRMLKPVARRYARYFSLVHILNAGTTKDDLTLHRDALAKAINHLTWMPDIVKPAAIESTYTIYRIDLRELGWERVYHYRLENDKPAKASTLTLFDLALLEYPYGTIPEASETYFSLLREYLIPAGQVRPIPYVRADWFVSVVTQPPLYHDFLQLPLNIEELEHRLGVESETNVAQGRVLRAGMINSGVSRNNRVVERHTSRYGAYWKSFDFASNQAQENIFQDPVNLHPSGGEMVFHLPNGLQGYLIVNDKGKRINDAPTSIVVDPHASDRTVRNGLACMRCHERGMKGFADDVRRTVLPLPDSPGFSKQRVLQLYPEQAAMDRFVKADEERFMGALEKALGKPQVREPLTPVTRRYLDERLNLATASAELGLADPKGLRELFRLPQFVKAGLAPLAADEGVARDTWEDNHGRVVAELGLGSPIVPLDALSRASFEPRLPPLFELEVKTNKKNNSFAPKEEFQIFVKPTRDVYVEIIATSLKGRKTILAPATTLVKAGQQFQYPSKGKTIKVPGTPGKEFVTVIASDAPFIGGEVLRGDGVADRVVHPYAFRWNGRGIDIQTSPDPARTVKKTMTIETR